MLGRRALICVMVPMSRCSVDYFVERWTCAVESAARAAMKTAEGASKRKDGRHDASIDAFLAARYTYAAPGRHASAGHLWMMTISTQP